jgi:hypothetical protein
MLLFSVWSEPFPDERSSRSRGLNAGTGPRPTPETVDMSQAPAPAGNSAFVCGRIDSTIITSWRLHYKIFIPLPASPPRRASERKVAATSHLKLSGRSRNSGHGYGIVVDLSSETRIPEVIATKTRPGGPTVVDFECVAGLPLSSVPEGIIPERTTLKKDMTDPNGQSPCCNAFLPSIYIYNRYTAGKQGARLLKFWTSQRGWSRCRLRAARRSEKWPPHHT